MAVVMVRPRRKKGKSKTATEAGTGQFSLRPRLARLIPHNAMFEPEITEDGVLYRFVGLKGQAKRAQEPVPEAEWLNADGKQGERGASADKLVAVTDDELEAVQRMRRQSQSNYAKAQG